MLVSVVRNWYHVLSFKWKMLTRCTIHFRDGDVVETQRPVPLDWDTVQMIVRLKYDMRSFRLLPQEDAIRLIVNNEYTFLVDKYHVRDTLVLIAEQIRDDYYRLTNRSFINKTVIDIGANIGDATILFAKKGATVYAFEPIPLAFRQMQINISLNSVGSQVHLFNVALSDHDEERDIVFNPYGMGGFSLNGVHEGAELVSAKITLVDTIAYLRKQNILCCDVLKMDCEGCEVSLLNDSRILDYLRPQEIMIEYHSDNSHLILNTISDKYENVERVPFTHAPHYGMIYAKTLRS